MSEISEASSENNHKYRPRESRKRQVHNELERKRKDKINGWISKIGELLPGKELHKQSKISLLEQTVDYIKILVSERDKLLANRCSEVQGEEIKKLKREIRFLTEQNVMYKKLLHQSNTTLSSHPQKKLKYSNKFVRTNGILTVKNTEKKIKSCVDKATQVNMCLNIPNSKVVNTNKHLAKDSKRSCDGGNSKNKQVSKSGPSAVKLTKIVSAPVDKHPAPITCIPSCSVVTKPSQTTASASEDNVVPIVNCYDSSQQPSFPTGGVTTVLSQLPVMSTNSSFSNVCSKHVPTFIIPSGGSILQQFVPERSQNTISVLCPSTLPILVPQQVFSVSSVARNMGIQPTIICPAHMDTSSSQVEKSTVGGALLTINSNSVVPISSSFPSNTQIIIPSQSAVIGSNNINLTQNVVTPLVTDVSQTQSDSSSVPSTQKQQDSSKRNIESEAHINSISSEENSIVINKRSKTVDNALKLKKETLSAASSQISKFCPVLNNQKKSIRDLRNLCVNSPPSLQVLSANKIISLASQSQKKQTNNLSSLKKKANEKLDSVSVSNSKRDSSGFKINSETRNVEMVESQAAEQNESDKNSQQKVSSAPECIKNSDSTPKSKFSLTVLIGTSENKENGKNTNKQSATIQKDASGKKSESSLGVNSVSSNLVTTSVTACAREQNKFNVPSQMNKFSDSKENLISVKASTSTLSSTENTQNQCIRLSKNKSANSVIENAASCDFSTLNDANVALVSNSYNLDTNKFIQKDNSLILSSKNSIKIANAVQNNPKPSNGNSESVENNNCDESAPYAVSQSSVNQALLPSLFSTNQIMGLNSQILVCQTAEDNSSAMLLPSSSQISNDNSNQTSVLHNSDADFHAYSVMNKDVVLQTPVPVTQVLASDISKKVPETITTFSGLSSVTTVSMSDVEKMSEDEKALIGETCDTNGNKHTLKDKSVSKNYKSASEKSDLNNSADLPDSHSATDGQTPDDRPSSSKYSSTGSTNRHDSSNFIFTSDILARATESIFGNDTLDSPQMPRRNENCFIEESSDGSVALSSAEKAVDNNYKLQYNYIRENENNSEGPPDKGKKNTLIDLRPSSVTHSQILQNGESGHHLQELNLKSNKLCKVRKAKSSSDCEPLSKKLKEASPEKSSNSLVFNTLHQIDKEDKSMSVAHSNLVFLEKQVPSSMHPAVDEQNVQLGNFQNQINLPDNSCKTPTSVDAIFSLTPMLGDILKDVSHNVNFDPRNTNFLLGNENQAVFSAEKNLISFNYPNNSNEEYLNLPRMYFPIIPEVSSAPLVHVTNVSFAHTVSLCSTQSDSQKSTETHPSSDSQSKNNSKKKDLHPVFHSNQNLSPQVLNTMPKHSDCILKITNSEPHFNVSFPKVSSNSNNNSASLDNSEPHFNVSSSKVSNSIISGSMDNSGPHFNAPSSKVSNNNNSGSMDNSVPHFNVPSSKVSNNNSVSVDGSGPHFNAPSSKVSNNNNSGSIDNSETHFNVSSKVSNSITSGSMDNSVPHLNVSSSKVSNNNNSNSLSTSGTHFNVSSSKVSNNNINTNSVSHFSVLPSKAASNTSGLFETQHSVAQPQNVTSVHSNLSGSQPVSQCQSRENFLPAVSQHLSFYPTISSTVNIQHYPSSTSALSHVNYNISSSSSASSTFHHQSNTVNSYSNHPQMAKPESLSHSLCSLLKDSSSESRVGPNETSSQNTISSSVSQSKYSALSLISDQVAYSDSASSTTCHHPFNPVQSSSVYTTSAPDGQYITSVSSCGRNPKSSLSYSAESLLQTSCGSTEKNKNKNNTRYIVRSIEKKADRTSISNMHSVSDANIFMPVSSCDISIQNAPLVPLPPVTSLHNFPSNYSICETASSTTVFNSVSKAQDIPLSLSNDTFLNHMNISVDSQILNNRHEITAATSKPHSNIPMPFENHNSLYNNCNFLPHVKPTLENSRSLETPACFQPSYSNNYTQQTQKPNCCHFTHRTVATNSEIPNDINLPVAATVSSFHTDKTNFQTNRTSFTQSNSNFMGNFFYNSTSNCRDGNDLNVKPSTNRPSQEIYVPEGVRQNIHDPNAAIIFNNRKTVQSNRTKSKKLKNASNENNVLSTCITNYSSPQDCNKTNISYVSNGYFKTSSHPVLPAPSQIQCPQNKMSETVPPPVMPPNPSFNPVLHQQSDNFLNLNFQHPNFTMSPLPRPPTQPLSSSCLTTPIISHTFSSSTPHPVPNFNLSNILPDMGCSSNQVPFSPPKFPINNLTSSSTQCQTNSSLTNSAHIISHQSCAPSLYPPHPPMVRSSLTPILGHNSQSLIDNQVSIVGTAGATMPQNTTFATQNPSFRNVMHSITFPRSDR